MAKPQWLKLLNKIQVQADSGLAMEPPNEIEEVLDTIFDLASDLHEAIDEMLNDILQDTTQEIIGSLEAQIAHYKDQ